MSATASSHLFRRFVGVIAMVPVTALLSFWEWSFIAKARRGEAVVSESGVFGGTGYHIYGRQGGKSIADVTHVVDGKPVQATLATWFHRPKPGQSVSVLYPRDNPRFLLLDRFWECHFASALSVLVLAGAAIFETKAFIAWRRRQNSLLLRD